MRQQTGMVARAGSKELKAYISSYIWESERGLERPESFEISEMTSSDILPPARPHLPFIFK